MSEPESLPRRTLLIGAVVAAAIGLAATAWGVFSPAVLEHYSDSPDSVGIAQFAESAGPAEMLRWLHGQWIQTSSPPYYRPLSSFLFWLEFRLFGWNFQGHVLVSWLVHGVICVLLYTLALRLLPGPRRFALASAIIAIVLFNVRLGPEGPQWRVEPVAYGVVAWWPGQTDQFSLLASLLALLAFDRWLCGEMRRGLMWAIGLWVVALLFKEMAIVLPGLAMLLVIYRGGWQSLAVPWRGNSGEEVERGMSPGLAWVVGGIGLAAAVGYLALRATFVPIDPNMLGHGPSFYAHKAIFLLASRPWAILVSRGPWVPVAAVVWAAAILTWLDVRTRPSGVWLVLGLLLAGGVIAQLVGGNFALMTIPVQLGCLGTLVVLALGIGVLAHVREAWAWLLLAMALVVHVPLLWVWGPHYFYWPAAMWALFSAGLWQFSLMRWWEPVVAGARGRNEPEPESAAAGDGV